MAAIFKVYDNSRWSICIILLIPLTIIVYNACVIPIDNIYDVWGHLEYMKFFAAGGDGWIQLYDATASMYSPIYYYFGAVLIYLFKMTDNQVVTCIQFFNIISYMVFLYCVIHIYFKLYEKDIYYDFIFIITLTVIPNLYLFNAMIRPEAPFYVLIPIFIIFYNKTYSLFNTLMMFIIVLLISLVKHSGLCLLPVFLILMFLKMHNAKINLKKTVVLTLLLTICASSFYISRAVKFGHLMPPSAPSLLLYKNSDAALDRVALFSNMEFLALWETPNRRASFANGNNSVFPRLYGDMWGDHWLYFSGDKLVETKTTFKRIAFIIGIPFTLLLIGSIFFGSWTFIISAARRQIPSIPELGAVLSGAVFLFLMLAIYIHPESGKNGMVKFTYIMPTVLFAGFAMQEIIRRFVHKKIYALYFCLLFATCLPLYVFTK